MSILSKPYFHNEDAAYAKLESIVWPNGPACPHCGATDRIYDLKGKTARPGLRKCGHCRKQFTVKVGTVFESSHVPLYKWLQATYLIYEESPLLQAAHEVSRVDGHQRLFHSALDGPVNSSDNLLPVMLGRLQARGGG